MVYDIWGMVYGSCYMAPSTWHMAHGTWYVVHGYGAWARTDPSQPHQGNANRTASMLSKCMTEAE